MDNRAIGVFDSGIGGVTATCELEELMPNEKIIFLGDSYNMPYGEKSADDIKKLSCWDADFLLGKNVKAIFVACGTATSNALTALRERCSVPVIGVVEPAVKEALGATKNGKIGLLATEATVSSGAFCRTLAELDPKTELTVKACPKFVTMVEQGIFDKNDERVRAAVWEYLPDLKSAGVDTVILGCTHYPLLSDVIKQFMGENVRLISSGAAAARSLRALLIEKNICGEHQNPKTEFYTTGGRPHFAGTAACILKRDISESLRQIPPLIL